MDWFVIVNTSKGWKRRSATLHAFKNDALDEAKWLSRVSHGIKYDVANTDREPGLSLYKSGEMMIVRDIVSPDGGTRR